MKFRNQARVFLAVFDFDHFWGLHYA